MQIRICQFNGIEVVALRNQQIFPAIIVEIKKTHAPSGVCQRHPREPRLRTHVSKCAVAFVLIKRITLIGQVRNNNIWPPVVIVVRKIDSHARVGTAVNVHRNFGNQSDFFESSVAFIVVQKFHHRIIRKKQIDMTVAIIIRESYA